MKSSSTKSWSISSSNSAITKVYMIRQWLITPSHREPETIYSSQDLLLYRIIAINQSIRTTNWKAFGCSKSIKSLDSWYWSKICKNDWKFNSLPNCKLNNVIDRDMQGFFIVIIIHYYYYYSVINQKWICKTPIICKTFDLFDPFVNIYIQVHKISRTILAWMY